MVYCICRLCLNYYQGNNNNYSKRNIYTGQTLVNAKSVVINDIFYFFFSLYVYVNLSYIILISVVNSEHFGSSSGIFKSLF